MPYLSQPALAAGIVADFLRDGLDPFLNAHARAEWSRHKMVNAGPYSKSLYSPVAAPIKVAVHLNGLRLPLGPECARQLGAVCYRAGWGRDDYVPSTIGWIGLLLRSAGFTPYERCLFLVELFNGRQIGKFLEDIRVTRSVNGSGQISYETKVDWTTRSLAPLAALCFLGVNGGLRNEVTKPSVERCWWPTHRALNQAEVGSTEDLAAKLKIVMNRARTEARLAFAKAFDAVLEGLGVYSTGMSFHEGVESHGCVIDYADDMNPVELERVDGLWVFQYLLGDHSPEIRQVAFDALVKLRYGITGDGKAILRQGGEGAYPFGVERVLLDAAAAEPALLAGAGKGA